jgi:hypothetical protein
MVEIPIYGDDWGMVSITLSCPHYNNILIEEKQKTKHDPASPRLAPPSYSTGH